MPPHSAVPAPRVGERLWFNDKKEISLPCRGGGDGASPCTFSRLGREARAGTALHAALIEKVHSAADSSGFSAVRLAHLLWEQGVEGSNPLTPTGKQNPPQQSFTIAAADFLMGADQAERKVYLFDFRRLQLLQSIWQFSIVVLPPSLHGVIWSPSISVMSQLLPHWAHTPCCRS